MDVIYEIESLYTVELLDLKCKILLLLLLILLLLLLLFLLLLLLLLCWV